MFNLRDLHFHSELESLVLQERFDPIVDSTSGRDFIPTMLFGSVSCVSAGDLDFL